MNHKCHPIARQTVSLMSVYKFIAMQHAPLLAKTMRLKLQNYTHLSFQCKTTKGEGRTAQQELFRRCSRS